MKIEEYIRQCQDFLSKDLEECLDFLISTTAQETSQFNDVIFLKSRSSYLKLQELRGVSSNSEIILERNKLINSILLHLEKIKPESIILVNESVENSIKYLNTVPPDLALNLLSRVVADSQSGKKASILNLIEPKNLQKPNIKPDCSNCNNLRFIKLTSNSFFGELTKLVECPICK